MTGAAGLLHRGKTTLRRLVLSPLGRRLGAPAVHLSSPYTRGGNYLYYWMWAYGRDRPGRPARVLRHPVIDPWLVEFPLLDRLSIRREDASTLLSDWVGTEEHHFGSSFGVPELETFARALAGTSPRFRARRDRVGDLIGPETCVVNVRRGDYYAFAHLEAMYGIDVMEHVRRSLGHLRAAGRDVEDVLLVSDDVDWCREHLTPLFAREPRVLPGPHDMFDDLAALSSARSLVLSNSTFAFWGSHLAAALQPDHVAIAPPLHFRDEDGRENRDAFDPRWRISSSPV